MKSIRPFFSWIFVTLAGLCFSGVVYAQRPNENAVAEAGDAFGTSVGREVIGLYTSMSARGFSPAQAGNLRISGLYFDQVNQANLVNRIVRGNTVHVGISAQGFPFPAPTGVVDFQLRTPGEDPAANVLLGLASFKQQYAEVDFQAPVIPGTLSVGGGFGYSHNNIYQWADSSSEASTGLIARWQATDRLVITPFWGELHHREFEEKPYVFLGDSTPIYRDSELSRLPFGGFASDADNYGTTARYELSRSLLLEAGLFRSELHTHHNREPFLFDTNANGEGDYELSVSPKRTSTSTSGELRLSKIFISDHIRNTLYFSVKGRDRSQQSGGADTVDFGPATLRSAPFVQALDYPTGPTTLVKTQQMTPGIAYEGLWKDVGELSLGVQRPFYDNSTQAPGTPEVSASLQPWLYNIGAAGFVTKQLVVYASSTRGFEEIGLAPVNARNRDQAEPAQLTKQVDAGIKYSFSKSLALVAGVFKIDKPYFDLDTQNFFRQIGTTSNRGVELSLSGALTDRFTVVAGYIYIDPTVNYDAGGGVQAERTAIGPIPGLLRANFQYRPAFLNGLIFDTKVESTSSRYARYQEISLPAVTSFDVGARYNTNVLRRPATWRLQVYNVGNAHYLIPQASGMIQAFDERHAELSLAFSL